MTKRVNLGLKEALKEKEERKRKRQELEDKGWVTQKIGWNTTTEEPTPSKCEFYNRDYCIPCKSPEKFYECEMVKIGNQVKIDRWQPKETTESTIDPKELEIARLKALLAEKEAAVIEETIEEVVLETAAELAEEEDTIKEDGE